MARDIALSHHERYDGTGYPLGLSGENIAPCGYNECGFDRVAIRFDGGSSEGLEVEGIAAHDEL